MQVEATRTGFRDLRRYREGAKFTIDRPEEFSAAWMKPVGEVPKDFAEVVDRKTKEFVSRKTPEERRREFLANQEKERARIQAETLGAALAGAIGPAFDNALASLREEHAKLMRGAAPPPSEGGDGKGKGARQQPPTEGGDGKGK